ncbi:hypothetical protein K1719_008253 [Acacia pycnantha]|nr:hypothetical protein K1719_008253 [Acacia pycnantha]
MSVPSGRILLGGESEGMVEDEREDLGRRKRKVRFAAEEFTGEESLKVLNVSDGISVDFSNPLCPKFTFEEKEKERLLKPFKRTLVVKLLGRQPSYGFMVNKLRQIWERKGNIDIFDLENDFYLINFQHQDDYMEALIGGPWVISDLYLSVARWKPEFNPKRERIESVVDWVRFLNLLAPLFDKKFLLNLGNSIGKAIRLDIHTAQRARGKFARMCVELDLTEPLVPEFNVDGKTLSVVYESLNLLCNKCGWYGHNRVGCEAFHRRQAEEGMEVKVELQGGAHSGSRFTVLNADAGTDEGGPTEEGVRKETTASVSSTKGQRVENNHVQKKYGKNSSMGDGNKGAGKPRNRDMGGSMQETRKVLGEKNSKGASASNKGGSLKNVTEAKNGIGSCKFVPESNLSLGRRKEVDMEDKENMHLGEVMDGVEIDTGEVKCVEEGTEPIGGLGLSMGEILVWNCRGAASKGIAVVLRDLRFRHKVDFVVILEPRVSGGPTTRVIKNWGFKHSIREEVEGFSGGIWMLWNLDKLYVDVLVKNDQFIHCKLRLEGKELLFIVIYASPSEQRRHITWDSLHTLAGEVADPWLLVGDFNEIKSPLEQKGGGRVNETRCRRFKEWIQHCNLLDIEADGPFFTWKGPKWEGLDRVYKRLGRCLCNLNWLEKFDNVEFKVLPRVGSDHHPIRSSKSGCGE